MSATMTNGKTRRTLAEQIDRLDRVLDGLVEGLNEAVAAAVREAAASAVQDAVREALLQVLTNPDVLTLLGTAARAHSAAPPIAEAASAVEPGLASTEGPARHRSVGRLGAWAGRQVAGARAAWAGAAAAGRDRVEAVGARLLPLWRFRRRLLIAVAVGAGAGLAGYLAGPWVAGALSGLAAFASALAGRACHRLGRRFAVAVLRATP